MKSRELIKGVLKKMPSDRFISGSWGGLRGSFLLDLQRLEDIVLRAGLTGREPSFESHRAKQA